MKHKLTSLLMAILVTVSVCVPTFADDGGDASGDNCGEDYFWQLILRLWCGCGTRDEDAPENQEQPGEPEQPEQPQKPEPQEPEELPAANEPAEDTVSAYEREVARLVNIEREKAGLAPLELDAELSRVARMKSQDMHDRGYFDHNSPTYGTPYQLMKSQGVRYNVAGENIAMGYRTPEAVVSAWMVSPGHRANILKASYTKIGVGYVADGNYWTQHFIG
ncbi:MAG: hypothetical protein J5449_00470 [Oscillospiraceae bacterium]|nr:hypothetical protein [Oscillospiraceae bacterium]